jgi:hypothetical protein
MRRPVFAATLLAALVSLGALAPGVTAPVAAASCSGWTSETTPPPTIRVYRHATGAVDTVDFQTYAANVLSREWIGSWTTESLRSGALAVKNYAWYQVLHWRGGVNASGQCFDLRDDTYDQVYDPSTPTWSTAAAAVNDTWSTMVTKSGHIFATYYNAGTVGEPCGANANGWKAYQWGTQACGLAGMSASQIILTYYYPGVTVTGAPPSGGSPTATPTPTPTPAPSATATATPTPAPSATATPTPAQAPTPTPAPAATSTPVESASPTPTPASTAAPTPEVTSTPRPTPAPTATPRPTPVPSVAPPPSGQQQPGGGQLSLATSSAPPPPPPSDPTPAVAALPPSPAERAAAARLLLGDPAAGPTEWPGLSPRSNEPAILLVAVSGHAVGGGDLPAASPGPIDPRLAAFRALIGPAMDRLATALLRDVAPNAAVARLP